MQSSKKSGVISALTMTLAALSAQAQEQEPMLEEVVVSGIRHSILGASDRKRDSEMIVDSLVAEDVGKFPDSNVAEALQRISGVSIDRSGGEGNQVTVRGFGPAFNTVLVNGRRLASDAEGRAFNFDMLSAELIGGADVYKTSSVELQEGGIGSTINLRTQRPLELGEFKAVGSIKGIYDDRADSTSPQAFGFVSNTFADDTMGVLVSVSHQERETYRDLYTVNGWFPRPIDESQSGDFFADGQGNGADTYFFPRSNRHLRDKQERTRTGLTGVFQYRPVDNVTLTLDALYSDFDVESSAVSASNFVNPNTIRNAVPDSDNVLASFDWENKPDTVVETFNRPADVKMFGANLEWAVTDSIDTSFDLSISEAENGAAGENYFVVVQGEPSLMRYDNTLGTDTPLATVQQNLTTGQPYDRSSTENLSSWFTGRNGETITDEVTEARFDVDWHLEFGPVRTLSFGVLQSSQTKEKVDKRSAEGTFFGALGPISLPSSLFSGGRNDGFLDGADTNFDENIVSFDPEAIIQYLETDEALAERDTTLGLAPGTSRAEFPTFDAVLTPGSSFKVKEDIFSLYTNAALDFSIADMPLVVNVGVRYTSTDIESTGSQRQLLDLLPNDTAPDVFRQVQGEPAGFTEDADYTEILPSINARLDINDSLIARLAYSESISRPELTQLSPSIEYAVEIRPSNLTASAGNPALEPFKAKNWDASLEWYYNDTGFLTVGLFKKRIDGFIVDGAVREAIAIENAGDITGPNFTNDSVFFDVQRPRNLEETSVEGLEISFQHTFDYLPSFLSSLGVIANATFVDTADEFDVNSFDNTLALPGLGDSENFVLFYDDGRIEARVAYNNRDRFFTRFGGAPGEPFFTEERSQIDIRAAWNITDTMQVFFEGLNVTDELLEIRGRYDSQIVSLEQTGARYSMGLRASF